MSQFIQLGVAPAITDVLSDLGYETPTPIQAQSIPVLLQGRDVLAQAQTGTGKTAAFALPALTMLDVSLCAPQVLVLAPTRELAIQVAESFQSYAKKIKDFRVLPIYGGADYRGQLKALKRGVHVVVGTPGRVMDHLRRDTLVLDETRMVILDEADEMLKMGFIDDVKWILEQIPGEHQTALYSATMPSIIQKVAKDYLQQPEKIRIKPTKSTLNNIQQLCSIVRRDHKIEALNRFLEVEDRDATIIFTRTKTQSDELAVKLSARGYAAAAINGDLAQATREKMIKSLKLGHIDIIVATDVAARGLDVDRITHVINFDIPHDSESYVHRIGRTGRAGRQGTALLLVTPKEQRMLKTIERATGQAIKVITPPTLADISKKRSTHLANNINQTIKLNDLDDYRAFIETLCHQHEVSELDVAAALAKLLRKGEALNTAEEDNFDFSTKQSKYHQPQERPRRDRKRKRGQQDFEAGMTRCRIELGRKHGLRPGEVVAVIAEAGNISSREIGRIDILDSHSFVDLSDDVATEVVRRAKKAKIKKHPLGLSIKSAKRRR